MAANFLSGRAPNEIPTADSNFPFPRHAPRLQFAMPSDFDPSEFVDSDVLTTARAAIRPTSMSDFPSGSASRPPSREELDHKVSHAQQQLAELKRKQDELERERAGLEEARRRRVELQTGREEMLHHLTRGLVLLEEAELKSRRDAEQMAKSLSGLRESLDKVSVINEETWNAETYNVELTRALTAIENARMEWNTARLKWPALDAALPNSTGATAAGPAKIQGHFLGAQSFGELCRLGFALTWPVAVAVLLGAALMVLLKR
jgi:DNA-binding transcriptional regulator of glucitol operon